jgi:hypothetical protein
VGFSVPASLAEDLPGRAWVQVGSTVVPLPPIVVRGARGEVRPPATRESVPSEPQQPAAPDPDRARLLAELDHAERLRRLAEQRAHAEQSLRIELEEELAERDRQLAEHQAVLAELAAAEEELRVAREAESLPSAPVPAEQSERRDPGRALALRSEAAFARRALAPGGAPRRASFRPRASAAALALERQLIAARAAGEERVGAALSELEQRLSEHASAASRRESTVDELRAELRRLAVAVEGEIEAREAAERELAEQRRRTASAAKTLAELRAIVAGLRGEPVPAQAAEAAEVAGVAEVAEVADVAEVGAEAPAGRERPAGIDVDRFDAALTRLRQAAPEAEEPVQADSVGAAVWVKPALQQLVKREPAIAGALLLELYPGVVAGLDPARLARLVTAGPLRWWLSGARHRTSAVATLRVFVREPQAFAGLAAGLDPVLALTLVSAMIDPAWTVGERFTVGHRVAGRDTYLRIRAGRPPAVAQTPPLGPVAATICCGPDELVAVLAGRWPAGARISGSRQRVELIQAWVRRAQGI